MLTVNKEEVRKPLGAKSDIGVKIMNEELNQGRCKKRTGEKFGAVENTLVEELNT